MLELPILFHLLTKTLTRLYCQYFDNQTIKIPKESMFTVGSIPAVSTTE